MNSFTKTALIPILCWTVSCSTISKRENLDSSEFVKADTALLILDVQKDFFPGGKFELEEAEQAASRGKIVLEYFRKKEWPVIHIQHVSTRKGATFFFPGTAGVQLEESNAPISGETTLIKHTVNAFINTGLEEELKRNKVKKLVIYGMMTHMVVDSTVRAAFDMGYKDITVISDACATKELSFEKIKIPASRVHASFLSGLGYIFAKIKTSSEFVQTSSD
ncbi:cysteine hydrolase [Leptospira barantonii]|uniref:Cysteine hydrolase n=1 Tax=Leptospira barantonii TaxID=2023184 RepID=A0A5F2BNQ4_9LEPT|nr:cysteine hydrolase family protein [Leptospira barantonii]TGM07184.1 cysteine hydrolase [Leptospira barantonii]